MNRIVKNSKMNKKGVMVVSFAVLLGTLFLLSSFLSPIDQTEFNNIQDNDFEDIHLKQELDNVKAATQKNVNITVLDLENNPLSGANVELFFKSEFIHFSYENQTNQDGIASFYSLPHNLVWDVNITHEHPNGDYNITVFYSESVIATYEPGSPDYQEITLNANLTAFNLTIVDESSGNGLIGASLLVLNETSEEIYATFDTPIDGSGNIYMKLPETTYKLKILYGGDNISYMLPKLGDYDPEIVKTISLSVDIDWDENYVARCVLSDFHSKINFLNVEFTPSVETGSWKEEVSYTSPYSLGMYYENMAKLKLQWINTITEGGISAPQSGADWNFWEIRKNNVVINSSAQHPDAVQPITGESGNYSFIIGTQDYYSGNYMLTLKLNRTGYQDALFYLSIGISNFTTTMLRNITGNIEVQYNAPLNIGFNYTSLLPYQKNIESAILYYSIPTQPSFSGILEYDSNEELYVLSKDAVDIPVGTYNLRVWGNATNYGFESRIYTFIVEPLDSNLEIIIDPEYRVSSTFMKTTTLENVSFMVNYTDVFNNPVDNSINDLSILVNGSALDDKYITLIESGEYEGMWDVSFPATVYNSSSFIDNVAITIGKQNYVSRNFDLTVQIKPYWNTTIDLMTPPDPYIWGDNISLTLRYSCSESPSPVGKVGLVIENANLDYINISTKSGLIYTTVLQLNNSNRYSVWDWEELDDQPGHYKFWVLSEILEISEETRYYLIPQLSKELFQTRTKNDIYIDLSLLESSLNCFDNLNPNTELAFFTLDKSLSETMEVLSVLKVSDTNSHLEGQIIEDMILTYEIYNRGTHSLVNSGDIIFDENNGYLFIIDSTNAIFPLGQFNFTVFFSDYNYTDSSATFNFNITTKIDFSIAIPDIFRLGENTMRAALMENFTFYINISDSTGDYNVEVFLNGDPTPIDFIYDLGDNEFRITNESEYFSIGMHSFYIKVSDVGDPFTFSESFIELDIIEKWNTEFEVITPANDAIWGENVTFIIKHMISQNPRQGTLISGSEILNITFLTGNQIDGFVFNISDSSFGDVWFYHEIVDQPGYYSITFNTSVLRIEKLEFPLIYLNISHTSLYNGFDELEEGTRKVKIRLFTVGTDSTYSATDTASSSFVDDFSFLALKTGEETTIIFNYTINDPTSPFNGMSLRELYGEDVSIYYEIFNQTSGELHLSGYFEPSNVNIHSWNLTISESSENFIHEEYLIKITASIANYTSVTKQFALIIGEAETVFEYNFVYPDLYQGNPGQLNLYRMANSENLTIDIQIDNLVDGVEPSVTFSLYDGFGDFVMELPSGFFSRESSDTMRFDMKFDLATLGLSEAFYDLRIYCNLPGYLPSEKSFTIDLMEYWPTRLHVVNPPMIYAWGNTLNFNVSYYILPNILSAYPRNGDFITGASITSVDIFLILDDETQLMLHLTEANISQGVWRYEEMFDTFGEGYYQVWFNVSFLDLTEEDILTYYIVPTIQQGVNNEAHARPRPNYSVYPVPTAFTIEQTSSIQDLDLTNMILYLNDDLSVNLNYFVTDGTSIFDGYYLGSGQLYFIIRDRTTNNIYREGYLSSYSNGTFYWDIPTIDIGNYSVVISAEKWNFESKSLSFGLLVQKYEITYKLDESIESNILDFPSNRNQTVIFDLKDWRTNQPITGATVFVEFNNQLIPAKDLGNGYYSFELTPEIIEGLNVGDSYPAKIIINMVNYTTPEDFTLQIRLNLPVDPYFGVPYVYWIVIGVVTGVFTGAVVARLMIKRALVPTIIKKIEYVRKNMKKGKMIQEEKLALNKKEEMYALFHNMYKLIDVDMANALDLEISEIEDLDEELKELLEGDDDRIKDLQAQLSEIPDDFSDEVQLGEEVEETKSEGKSKKSKKESKEPKEKKEKKPKDKKPKKESKQPKEKKEKKSKDNKDKNENKDKKSENETKEDD